MKEMFLRLVFFACLGLMLSACFGPKTPQEVTRSFWQSVLEKNAEDAVEYSTLSDPKYYDGFSKDWSGFQPSFGKVIIEKDQASIVSEFVSPANSGEDNRIFTTYLVRRNEAWKVDYDRTKNSIHGGAMGELFSGLNQLGNELSKQFESSAKELKRELDRLGKEFEQKSDSFGQQAEKNLEEYADQLRKSIKQLEESINRALKEENDNLSDQDKDALQQISAELDQESEELSSSNMHAVAKGGKHMGETQQRLVSMENDSLDNYKQEWREIGKQYEQTMREMMHELSSQINAKDKPQ